jgi:hypothetical protein
MIELMVLSLSLIPYEEVPKISLHFNYNFFPMLPRIILLHISYNRTPSLWTDKLYPPCGHIRSHINVTSVSKSIMRLSNSILRYRK